ncbi:MAG: hypothetical protein R3E96_09790 [Planctomycetota bacterium]
MRLDKGDSAGVRRAQLWLLESVIDADRARYEAALDDAVEAFPDDDNLLEEGADYYSGIGNAPCGVSCAANGSRRTGQAAAEIGLGPVACD